MAKYSALMSRTSSTTLPVGSIVSDSTTPRRGKIYYVNAGFTGAPADTAHRLDVQRCTAAGTSTAVTPKPLDPADAAALADCGENHTVDATRTAGMVILALSFNGKATVQWYAPPGSELVYPATAANGYALITTTTTALAMTSTVYFSEE